MSYRTVVNVTLIIFFSLFLSDCTNDNQILKENKTVEDETNHRESIKTDNETREVQSFNVVLRSNVIVVTSKVSGRIINSELQKFQPQYVDSTTLLISVDNSSLFKELRLLKNDFLIALNQQKISVGSVVLNDLNEFISLVQMDNLLPGLSPNKFSSDFIQWFMAQEIYSDYLKIQEEEKKMEDYFYINEEPIYLKKFYVKKDGQIERGQPLYSYLIRSKMLKFEVPFSYRESEIETISMKSLSSFRYEIKNGKLIVSLPFDEYKTVDSIEVEVKLKRLVS